MKKQLSELYGPIDDMFKELRLRLEQIPTVQQRAASAKRKPSPEPETHAPSEPQKRGE